MRWSVVELAENGRYAKVFRGFLVVMQGDSELGRVVLDEMSCLLLTADQATLSKPVMVRLAELGVPIVVSGKNYHPIALTLPYSAHHQSTRVLRAQIACSMPLRKRLWQALVRCKIQHQRVALLRCCPDQSVKAMQLQRLASKVRSGDPENIEAQASKVYWRALMGEAFRRKTQGSDSVNAALNYGYAIVRAACARATVAAGLHPALGLHHANQGNPFCLVDDLMEVYRPVVDQLVFQLKLGDELDVESKRRLAKSLQADIRHEGKVSTVSNSMQFLAASLVNSIESKRYELRLPKME